MITIKNTIRKSVCKVTFATLFVLLLRALIRARLPLLKKNCLVETLSSKLLNLSSYERCIHRKLFSHIDRVWEHVHESNEELWPPVSLGEQKLTRTGQSTGVIKPLLWQIKWKESWLHYRWLTIIYADHSPVMNVSTAGLFVSRFVGLAWATLIVEVLQKLINDTFSNFRFVTHRFADMLWTKFLFYQLIYTFIKI